MEDVYLNRINRLIKITLLWACPCGSRHAPPDSYRDKCRLLSLTRAILSPALSKGEGVKFVGFDARERNICSPSEMHYVHLHSLCGSNQNPPINLRCKNTRQQFPFRGLGGFYRNNITSPCFSTALPPINVMLI